MRLWPSKASTTSSREAFSWREPSSWRRVVRTLAGTGQPPLRTAVAVGVGVAIGLLPVMPFQTALAIGAALLFRLNRVAVWTPTLLWQPFTMPFIVAAEVWVGRAFVGASPAREGAKSVWAQWGWPLVVGSPVVAVGCGAACALVAYGLLRLRARQKPEPPVTEGGGE